MRIHEIVTEENSAGFKISALIESARLPSPWRFWLRVGANCRPGTAPSDVLLAALILPCMAWAEDMEIEGSVSQTLLLGCEELQTIFAQWIPGARKISIRPASVIVEAKERKAEGIGSFFSGGVDSFYTLQKRRASLTYLILVQGFDIPLGDEWRYAEAKRSVEKVAATEGKNLIEAATNIREITDGVVRWDYAHGPALAAVGLACGGTLGKVFIPSSSPYGRLTPWGSHPLVDPLWSNGLVEFVHDGCEAGRLEKILAAVCTSPIALQTLRVCWKNRNGSYNCGKCEKCLRTMLGLYIGGVLDQCTVFPKKLSPWRVGLLNFRYYWGLGVEIHDQLPRKTHYDRRLRRAVRRVIRRSKRHLALKAIFNR